MVRCFMGIFCVYSESVKKKYNSYELIHEPGFPVLKVGNRVIVVYPANNQATGG